MYMYIDASIHEQYMYTTTFRRGPQRQMQHEHINDLVSRLLKHPLGLYPHLEESIPPEVRMYEATQNVINRGYTSKLIKQ